MRAWALVFPSICKEPLPYAVIEAMALSTIPIASEVGGVPEVLERTPTEEHLFKPRDVDGLMKRIMGLSSRSVKESTKVGIKLRERALMLFDEEGVERRIIKAFKSTL
jgi:glycosyltransferase involved in cell wall biosynthesis